MTAPPVPAGAITAAARAIHADGHPHGGCDIEPLPQHLRCARAAIEAAAPVLSKHWAARLKAQIADEVTAICAATVLEAVAAERARWLPVLRAASDHITHLDNELWNRASASALCCAALEQAIAELIGADAADPEPPGVTPGG